ncbi:MAG: ATP-binding protein, partial [Bacteroidota bacterium]
ILMAVLQFFYGAELGVEYAYFNLVLFTVLFFEFTRIQILFLVYFILTYLISYFTVEQYGGALADRLNPNATVVMFLANLSVLFVHVKMFTLTNRQLEGETNRLLEDLKEKNKDLIDMKEKAENQNVALEEANTELERFAYIASHDLKTPLRNVSIFLSLLEQKLPEAQKATVSEYLTFAKRSAQRMYYLIEDILQFSQLGVKNGIEEEVDLNVLIQDIKEEVIIATKKDVNITFDQQLPKLSTNPNQALTLFQNLIENSTKYNEHQVVKILIESELREEHYCIRLTDNGLGIPKEYQEKVFDMFYRLHNQDQYEGTGIGLATCKKIMHKNGGSIRLASSNDQGSCFELIFPIARFVA